MEFDQERLSPNTMSRASAVKSHKDTLKEKCYRPLTVLTVNLTQTLLGSNADDGICFEGGQGLARAKVYSPTAARTSP